MTNAEIDFACEHGWNAIILIQKRRETLWKSLKMTPEEIEKAKRACKDVKPI